MSHSEFLKLRVYDEPSVDFEVVIKSIRHRFLGELYVTGDVSLLNIFKLLFVSFLVDDSLI